MNLRPSLSVHHLKTYMEICTFLGLMGHYQQFIKGFAWINQPLNEHLAREGSQ